MPQAQCCVHATSCLLLLIEDSYKPKTVVYDIIKMYTVDTSRVKTIVMYAVAFESQEQF